MEENNIVGFDPLTMVEKGAIEWLRQNARTSTNENLDNDMQALKFQLDNMLIKIGEAFLESRAGDAATEAEFKAKLVAWKVLETENQRRTDEINHSAKSARKKI